MGSCINVFRRLLPVIVFCFSQAVLAETLLQKELHDPSLHPAYWVAVVLGNSEQWGHHRAPPTRLDPDHKKITRVFEKRLDLGFRLLNSGVVRFLYITGGAIDRRHPEYVEARRGYEYLLDHYRSQFTLGGHLENRIVLDELAHTTVTNIRNADKFCDNLGIHDVVIATEHEKIELARESWYLTHAPMSFFRFLTRIRLKYDLGPFTKISVEMPDHSKETVLRHTIIRPQDLEKDQFGM